MHCVFLADLFFAESWGEPPDGMGSGIMPICSLLLPRRNGMHLTMEAYLPGIPVLYHSDTSALLQEDTSDNGTHLHRRQQLFLLYYRALHWQSLRQQYCRTASCVCRLQTALYGVPHFHCRRECFHLQGNGAGLFPAFGHRIQHLL